jgi:hypothetical protein
MLGLPYKEYYFYFFQYGDKIYVESNIGESYSYEHISVKCPIENNNDLVKLFSFYGLAEIAEFCKTL